MFEPLLKHPPVTATLLLVSATLAACGGGGGTSAAPAAPAPSGQKPLQLQGEVPLLDSGTVVATAGQKTWSAPISGGRYLLSIAPSDAEVVGLTASGTGSQSRIVLASLLGSGAELQALSGSDGVLDAGESKALKLNTLSTAQYGQLPVTELTAAQLSAARSTVDELEAYQVAAALQLLANNPDRAMPGGFSNTLQLAQSPLLRVAYANSVGKGNDSRYAEAAGQVGDGRLNATQLGGALIGPVSVLSRDPFNGFSVNLNADGTAELLDSLRLHADSLSVDSEGNYTGAFNQTTGRTPATWSVDAEGAIHVVPVGEFYGEFADLIAGRCTPPGGDPAASRNCLARSTLKEITLSIQSGGFGRHLAEVTTRGELRYLTGEAPPPVEESFTEFRQLTLPAGHYRFNASELANRITLLPVYDAANAAEVGGGGNGNAPELNYEQVRFNADGTGSAPRLGATLTWALANGGRDLQVSYSNGHSTVFRKAVRAKPQPYVINGEVQRDTDLDDLGDLFNIFGFGPREFRLLGEHRNSTVNLDFGGLGTFTTAAAFTGFTDATAAGRYNQEGVGREFKDDSSEFGGGRTDGGFVLELFADHTGRQVTPYVCAPGDIDYFSQGCTADYQVIYPPVPSGVPMIFWRVSDTGELVLDQLRFVRADGDTGGRCAVIGSSDGAGRTCIVTARRRLVPLARHGSRLVVQEVRLFTPFAPPVPIEDRKPGYLVRIYDRTPIPN